MAVLILVGFGWAVSVYGRPIAFAIGFAALSAFGGIVSDAALGEILFSTVVALLYCSGYFWLIDRYSESVFAYLAILFTGALLWFLAPLLLSN